MVKILTVLLPDIGEGVVEGEVIEWLKKEGDPVELDEAVIVVMTDKATVELPSPYKGILKKQYYAQGEIAEVHKPLYDVETTDSEQKVMKKHTETTSAQPQASEKAKSTEQVASCDRALATPAVKQLAKQLGIDLASVTPTGSNGQVTVEDVKRLVGKPAEACPKVAFESFPDDIVEPISGIRSLMAEAMTLSHKTIPQFSYFEQLDVTNLKKKREEKQKEIKTTLMPFYIHALSKALKEIPLANSSYDASSKKIYKHTRQNIGIAMDTPYGLIVPVIKGVEKMSLDEIIVAFDQLKTKAKNGQLASQDMKDATITVTNFGTLGGFAGTPIIPVPNVTILGLGKIEAIPAVVDGAIAIREKQMICWSFDHRLIDGATAAKLSSMFTSLLT